MRYINNGKFTNDGTADSIRVAAEKINDNFSEIFNKLRIKQPFKKIIWDNLSDTRQAMKDINNNFKQIEELLKKN